MEKHRFASGPIEEISWGRFVINGQENAKRNDGTIVGVGKDICLIGDQLQPWKERKGHLLTREMVAAVVNTPQVKTIIIGNGYYGALEVPDEVRAFVESKGKKLIVQKTPQACALYNELFAKGEPVALLAHGTC